jgi:hypothetical protein
MATFDSAPPMPSAGAPRAGWAWPGNDRRTMVSPKVTTDGFDDETMLPP